MVLALVVCEGNMEIVWDAGEEVMVGKVLSVKAWRPKFNPPEFTSTNLAQHHPMSVVPPVRRRRKEGAWGSLATVWPHR